MTKIQNISRRHFIGGAAGAAFVTGLNMSLPLPALAKSTTASGAVDQQGIRHIETKNLYNLDIGYAPFTLNGRTGKASAINGTVPGPLVKLREGDKVRLNVKNSMMDTEHSSIHWHGLLVPFRMDGVPGINFNGIQPGETYEYEFEVKQAGTYWYHSHSFFQEQTGTYGPLVIEPKTPEPFSYDRDYAVVL